MNIDLCQPSMISILFRDLLMGVEKIIEKGFSPPRNSQEKGIEGDCLVRPTVLRDYLSSKASSNRSHSLTRCSSAPMRPRSPGPTQRCADLTFLDRWSRPCARRSGLHRRKHAGRCGFAVGWLCPPIPRLPLTPSARQ